MTGFCPRNEFDAFSDYAFQEMDDDKNGTLGLDEAKPFLDIEHFRKSDSNQDNVVSRAEYDAQMHGGFHRCGSRRKRSARLIRRGPCRAGFFPANRSVL